MRIPNMVMADEAYIKRIEKAEREFDSLMGFRKPGDFGVPWTRASKAPGKQPGEFKTRMLTRAERQEMGLQ